MGTYIASKAMSSKCMSQCEVNINLASYELHPAYKDLVITIKKIQLITPLFFMTFKMFLEHALNNKSKKNSMLAVLAPW